MKNTFNFSPHDFGIDRSQVLYWPSILLFLLVITPVILIVGFETFLFISFLFFVLIWWLASRTKFPADLLYIINPLLLILCVGVLGSFGEERYAIIKDMWYVSNAAMALIVGYVLMLNVRDLRRLFSVFIMAAFLVAMLHLLRFAINPEMLSMDGVDVRKAGGGGENESVLALGLILAAYKMKMRIFGRHNWFVVLATPCFIASIFLSFSRTEIFSFAIIAAAVLGWVHFNNYRKTLLVILLVAVVLVLGLAISPEHASVGGKLNMMDKFLNSFQEVKARNYYSMQDISKNWRGFETSRAISNYLRGNPLELLVGGGFGATVDLGFFMPLGEPIRYLPVLHNGYMYLLVKTGAVGVLIYLWLLFRILRLGTASGTSELLEVKFCGQMIVGLGLAFLAQTYVVSGMFNKNAFLSTLLLLGALLAFCTSAAKDRGASL